MATLTSLRDPTGRWRIDRVFDSTEVDYRIFDRDRLVAEYADREDLVAFLKRAQVDIEKLKPPPGADKPWAKL